MTGVPGRVYLSVAVPRRGPPTRRLRAYPPSGETGDLRQALVRRRSTNAAGSGAATAAPVSGTTVRCKTGGDRVSGAARAFGEIPPSGAAQRPRNAPEPRPPPHACGAGGACAAAVGVGHRCERWWRRVPGCLPLLAMLKVTEQLAARCGRYSGESEDGKVGGVPPAPGLNGAPAVVGEDSAVAALHGSHARVAVRAVASAAAHPGSFPQAENSAGGVGRRHRSCGRRSAEPPRPTRQISGPGRRGGLVSRHHTRRSAWQRFSAVRPFWPQWSQCHHGQAACAAPSGPPVLPERQRLALGSGSGGGGDRGGGEPGPPPARVMAAAPMSVPVRRRRWTLAAAAAATGAQGSSCRLPVLIRLVSGGVCVCAFLGWGARCTIPLSTGR